MKNYKLYIYLFIFIFSAIYVFKNQNYSKRIEILNGYVVNFSVNRGDDIDFYLHPQKNHKQGIVCIYNIHSQIVDSLILNLEVQEESVDTLMYQRGYKYIHKFKYNTAKLKSGMYFIANVVPFIVKEPEIKESITVVFPYANFMALSNEGGKSFDKDNSTHGEAAQILSLNKSVWFRNKPEVFLQWLDSLPDYGGKLNIISDLDLENYSNIKNSKLIILYGYSSFWTYLQRQNFDQFLENGGNVLAICSKLMNNKFYFNRKENSLYFNPHLNKEQKLEMQTVTGIWNEILLNTYSVGCSYEILYGAKKILPSYQGYKIADKKHPIFHNVIDSVININTEASNLFAVTDTTFSTNNPQLAVDSQHFYSKQLLAYDYVYENNKQGLSGIALMRKTNKSGYLLVIGNEKWCWLPYFNQTNIKKVTYNSLSYLLKL
ncbi:MAG: hypothetical protein IT238_06260 [Bacteroidia bacterium]|nr:hypothetical protein [Bacteroidia bacterium]MCZ2249864.1 hypothetical protein [Bacteroidia bacterium]